MSVQVDAHLNGWPAGRVSRSAVSACHGSSGRRQAGFSLVEVSIVMAIVLLLAIIAVPTVRNYVIEGRVPKVGEELARYIMHTRINAASGSSTPYDGINTGSLVNMVRGSGILTVVSSGSESSVRHGLGSDGEVTVVAADSGAAFTVTLSKVHHAACPSIASVLQRLADTVSLTPDGGTAKTVKRVDLPYSALTTEKDCAQGDANTFAFTVS